MLANLASDALPVAVRNLFLFARQSNLLVLVGLRTNQRTPAGSPFFKKCRWMRYIACYMKTLLQLLQSARSVPLPQIVVGTFGRLVCCLATSKHTTTRELGPMVGSIVEMGRIRVWVFQCATLCLLFSKNCFNTVSISSVQYFLLVSCSRRVQERRSLRLAQAARFRQAIHGHGVSLLRFGTRGDCCSSNWMQVPTKLRSLPRK